MHEVFAGVRLWQLAKLNKLPEHAKFNGHRLFGKDRWDACWKEAKDRDPRDNLQQLCYSILHSSGFEDDKGDDVRTVANMEMGTILYCDERLRYAAAWPLYVEDARRPDCMAGVEQAFDVVLEYADGKLIRYAGTIDGSVIKVATGHQFLEENKTAARLDRGWRAAFDMSHQVTGYMACSTVVFGKPIMRARVSGLKIKLTHKGEDFYVAEVQRDAAAIMHWGNYVRTVVDLFDEPFAQNYEDAPRFTHSCNRFFRPCSLLTFCADTPEGRKEQWKQMVPSELSPTEYAIAE